MAKGNLPASLNFTKKWEGGYVDHPRDPGGATNMGITRKTLAGWRKISPWQKLPKSEVKNLTFDEATDIYRSLYWDRIRGDDLLHGLDLAVFDAGVNSGTSRAIKWLQRSVGAKVDGIFGPETRLKAVAASTRPAINRLCDIRLGFMRSLKIWETFGNGWSRRVAAVRAKSIAMYLQSINLHQTMRIETLNEERDRSANRSIQQGAGGAASGGGIFTLDQMMQLGPWLTAGLVILGGVLVAGFVVQAIAARDRVKAFETEIEKELE